MSLFEELKRRNVFRVAAAYLAGAWLLIQILETLLPIFGLAETSARIVVILLGIGFIPTVILAWAFEWTPEGIVRDSEVGDSGKPGNGAGKKLDRVIISALVLGIAYFAFDKFILEPERDAQRMEVVADQARTEALVSSFGDNSIAVLSFDDMSPEGDQEYFSDGIAEELLNLLAQVPELRVISRSSAFAFKGKDIHIPTVAKQLNVAHILEGSVRKSGNRVRITTQLIDAASDTHLWSETFDRELDDIFAIQDEIAATVVDELKITLLGDAPHARVIDTQALELMLEGRFHFNRRSRGDMEKALQLFEQAIDIDPDTAEALVGITPLYLWLFDPPRIEEADAAIKRAIELDPSNPEAWIRNANVAWARSNAELAESYVEKARELGPNNALVLGVSASRASSTGDKHQAVRYLQQALLYDPLHYVNLQFLADLSIDLGDFQAAREALNKLVSLHGREAEQALGLARISLLEGYPARALELISELPAQAPGPASTDRIAQIRAMAEYDLGNLAAADTAIREIEERYAERGALSLSTIYAWRGDTQQAISWARIAMEPDKVHAVIGKGEFEDPEFQRIGNDPAWKDFLDSVVPP